MSLEDNKTLVLRYYAEIANEHTLSRAIERADELLTDDFVFYPPNETAGDRGRNNHKGFLEWHHGVSPDQNWICVEVIAEADAIATRWTVHATQQGEFLGVPPSGKPYTLYGMDRFLVVDGRIAELRRYFDILTMMQQLGAIPE